MTEFTNTMAQMVAEARRSIPTVQGGGGGYAGHTNIGSAKQTSIGVDVGPFIQLGKDLLGVRSKDEILDQVAVTQNVWNLFHMENQDNPEKLHAFEANPSYQKKIKEAFEAGYGGAWQDEQGGYHLYPGKADPEAFQMSLQRLAIKQGDKASRNLTGAAGIAPPTEAEIASGAAGEQPRQQLVQTHRDINAPDPAAVELNNMKVENEKAALDLKKKEMDLLPEEFNMRQAEHAERMAVLANQKRNVDLEYKQLDLQTEAMRDGLTKENLKGISDVNGAYDSFTQAWMAKHVYDSDNETDNFVRNSELAAMTMKHIEGIKAYTDNPKFATKSLSYWFSLVDKEFQKPIGDPRTSFLGVGVPFTGDTSKVTVDQQIKRREYYLNTAVDLVSKAGRVPKTYGQKIDLWAKELGYTREDREKLLRALGYTPVSKGGKK